jgi:hypothetical protein
VIGLSLANTSADVAGLFLVRSTRGSCMLTALMVVLRSIGLICGGHRAIVLENLALRQQLAVLTRTVKRPQLRSTDRLFWVVTAEMSVLVAAVDVAADDGYASAR